MELEAMVSHKNCGAGLRILTFFEWCVLLAEYYSIIFVLYP